MVSKIASIICACALITNSIQAADSELSRRILDDSKDGKSKNNNSKNNNSNKDSSKDGKYTEKKTIEIDLLKIFGDISEAWAKSKEF